MLVATTQSPNSPSLMVAQDATDERRPDLPALVGLAARGLTGDELERHIASCGYLMLEAYKRYEASNCFGDCAEADRWRVLRDEAVKARTEAARGLNGR